MHLGELIIVEASSNSRWISVTSVALDRPPALLGAGLVNREEFRNMTNGSVALLSARWFRFVSCRTCTDNRCFKISFFSKGSKLNDTRESSVEKSDSAVRIWKVSSSSSMSSSIELSLPRRPRALSLKRSLN